jgi:hypothetical protein
LDDIVRNSSLKGIIVMRRLAMIGVALAVLASPLLAAMPAQAQPQALTWSIATPPFCVANSPCDITAKDASPLIFTVSGTTVTCTGSTLTGFLLTGNNVGNILGDILGPAATPFTGCTGGGFNFGTTGTFNWFVTGTSYAAGVTTGQVASINVQFATGNPNPCTFQITGAASYTYANAGGLLRFNPAVGLKDQLAVSNVSAGCGNTFADSPPNTYTATLAGTYTVIWDAAGTNPQITAA